MFRATVRRCSFSPMRFMLKQEKQRADMKKDFPLLSLQESRKGKISEKCR